MQDNRVRAFFYEGKAIRTVQYSGKLWWILKDICAALKIGNGCDISARLDDSEKGVDRFDTLRGKEDLTVINGRGLQHVVLLSRKPEAKKFKRWVSHEVRHSIRVTEPCATPETAEKLLNNPDFLIRVLCELKKVRLENTALAEMVSIQKQQISEMEHKDNYYDVVLACTDAVTIAAIAEDYGKSEQWMSNLLYRLGVQYKREDIWLLYPQYMDKGYTKSRIVTYDDGGIEHSQLYTYWKQSGRLFLYELLKKYGILPLIERDDATPVKITKRKEG